MTDVLALWRRYARIWSLDEKTLRDAEMAACLSPDVTYTDPQVSLSGLRAFAERMAGFRANLPGHRFEIRAVSAHHDRSLARWDMIDAAGSIVSPGVSFAVHTKEQKLLYITGFFDNMENILR